jgi:hypothetical protein
MSWVEGPISPNQPTNIASGGPGGVGDRYLRNVASGLGGAGGRQIMFNQDQWTGDYVSQNITQINAMVNNQGSTDLFLRLAVEGNFFERYGSTNAIFVPAGSGWVPVSFDLNNMTLVSGSDTLVGVLSWVNELRILTNEAGPDWLGDQVASTLGVDNITAAPEPASLALVALGAFALARRRK